MRSPINIDKLFLMSMKYLTTFPMDLKSAYGILVLPHSINSLSKLFFQYVLLSLLLLVSHNYHLPTLSCQATNVSQRLPFGAQFPIVSRAVAPDINRCGNANDIATFDCCSPSSEIVDFKLPSGPMHVRVRRPAHLASPEYMEKYYKAIEAMKALPKDDPRSFYQQANIHCAYCTAAYRQVGFPDTVLDPHGSWLFLPYHRLYLYFFELILGNLIDDPTFALPFWNYDSPEGMPIPPMFADPKSPLYDDKRHPDHKWPKLADLTYHFTEKNYTVEEQIKDNLLSLYKSIVSNANSTELFHGSPYYAGDEPNPGGGCVEGIPHDTIHDWLGDSRESNFEDMGSFHSAGRDPLFYAHHANIDRIWNIWKSLGGNRKDYEDHDWLDSSFLFYDVNAQLVRVKVRDSLDETKLGYVYQKVDLPWLNAKPTPKKPKGCSGVDYLAQISSRKLAIIGSTFPLKLDKPVSILVPRPKILRSQKEKDAQEEVLVVQNIEFQASLAIKIDIHINDDIQDLSGLDKTEHAGSFVSVLRGHYHGVKKRKTNFKIGIGEVLKELEAEGDESIVVTLVPRYYDGHEVTIGGVKIDFIGSITSLAELT